jgi:hypothetical protein
MISNVVSEGVMGNLDSFFLSFSNELFGKIWIHSVIPLLGLIEFNFRLWVSDQIHEERFVLMRAMRSSQGMHFTCPLSSS